MQLAVNYSVALAELVRAGDVACDLYKCPAWPDLIDTLTGKDAADSTPIHIHFPLLAGTGRGGPISTETGGAPDWAQIDRLLAQTGTGWVSAHLGPRPEDHPGLAGRPWEEQVAVVTDALIDDLVSLVARFGPEHVVGENIFEYYGMHLRAAVLPDVLTRAIEAAGCGLLLDLSHARLAAKGLGMDPQAYIEALPVGRLREVHVTGIQRFDARWIGRLEAAGFDPDQYELRRDQEIDHLPMTDDDWAFFAWALGRVRTGAWRAPEVVAFEYGGIGALFEPLTIPEVLAEQVPRLHRMVHAGD